MRILHICLAAYYVDGYSYQENIFPRLNKEAGHEVSIIASTETFIDNVTLGYVNPGRYETEYGVPIVRLPYVKVVNQFISAKLRKYVGLFQEICKFGPEIIYMHDLCFGSVDEVVKYKKKYNEVRLYADTHTAYYNSGTNWVSMLLLQRMYYRWHVKKVVKYLEKYYYIGSNEKHFSMEVYGVPDDIMEFLPLGGILPTDEEYQSKRNEKRKELKLKEDELLFLHTGKLDIKKKTPDLLNAFHNEYRLNAKLVIIGSLDVSVKDECEEIIAKDDRIIYLGWKSSDELIAYLCAADYYCQPGSPSVTMQNAICNRCIVIAYPTEGYEELDYGNFLWVKDEADIEKILSRIINGDVDVKSLIANTQKCAIELLDYNKLASRYCS